MRCTQFIGLRQSAHDFLKENFTQVESSRSTTGMFDEVVPLREWVPNAHGDIVKVREVEQTAPWSSGPMIFTCLEIEKTTGKFLDYMWKQDRAVVSEYDRGTGAFWV